VTRINRTKDVRGKDAAEVTQGGWHWGDMATEKLADERRPTGSDVGATLVEKECRPEESQGVWRQGDIGRGAGAEERRPKESRVRATWVKERTSTRGDLRSLASGRHWWKRGRQREETQGFWRQGDMGPEGGLGDWQHARRGACSA